MRTHWEQEIEAFDLGHQDGEGKPLALALPGQGALKLDRPLPFLALIRVPLKEPEHFPQLLSNASAFLLWDEPAVRQESGEDPEALLEALLRTLIRRLQPRYGAFLLLELWPQEQRDSAHVMLRKAERADDMWQTLQVRLPTLTFGEKLTLEYDEPSGPGEEWSGPLVADWARRTRVHQLGLGLPLLYLSPEREVFPSLFRAYRRKLDVILRHIFFAFMHHSTPERPQSFHALGPRSPAKLVDRVDRELGAISEAFSLLLAITPTNVERAFATFARHGYQGEPSWEYRPLTVDPAQLKADLFRIPIEQLDDPVFYKIFEQKRRQLELKITMLAYRRKPDFLHASLSLYGAVEPELKAAAVHLLERVAKPQVVPGERFLTAPELAARAEEEIAWYRRQDPRFTAQVRVLPDLGRSLMCQKGDLLIGSEARCSPSRVEALLQHEVGIHLVTTYNGRCQPLRQLSVGLADYLSFQEGLAMVAEAAVGGLDRGRLRHLAGRVLAVDGLLSGLRFAETFHRLREAYDFPLRALFEMVARVYRGGGFTKDTVYLRGLLQVLQRLPDLAPHEAIFAGKIGLQHIDLVKELQSRGVLHPAVFLPRFTTLDSARQRLAQLGADGRVEALWALSEDA